MSDTLRDPHTSQQLEVPHLTGPSMAVLEEAMKDLGDNLQKFQRSNGDRFLGNVVDGQPQGVGIMYYREDDPYGRVAYRGEFVDGQRHGIGIMWWTDGSSFEGQWKENKPEGYGLETYPDGGVYSGQFHDDSRHGLGAYAFADGKFFVGGWEGGVQHGKGISKTQNSSEIITVYDKGEIKEALPLNEDSKEHIEEIQAELSDILQQTETVAEKARTAAERIEVLNSVSTLLPEAVRPWSAKVSIPPTVQAAESTRNLLLPDTDNQELDSEPPTQFYSISRAASAPARPLPPKSPQADVEDRSTNQLFQSLKHPNAQFLSGNLGSFNSLTQHHGTAAAPLFSSTNLGSRTMHDSQSSAKAALLEDKENMQTKEIFASLGSGSDVASMRSKSVQSVKPSVKDSPQEDKESRQTSNLFSSLRLNSSGASKVSRSASLQDFHHSLPANVHSMPASPEIRAASVVDAENAEMKQLFGSLQAVTKSMDSSFALRDEGESAGTSDSKEPEDAQTSPEKNIDFSPNTHIFDEQTEAAVKIQSGLRGMMERRALQRGAAEQHEVEPIAESDEEDEAGDEFDEFDDEGTAESLRRFRDPKLGAMVNSASALQFISEGKADLGSGLRSGFDSLSAANLQGEKKSLSRERVVIKLEHIAEDAGAAGEEAEEAEADPRAASLDKINEDEEELEEREAQAAVRIQCGMRGLRDRRLAQERREERLREDLRALVEEGQQMLEHLSAADAEAVERAIGSGCSSSPVARALVDAIPPLGVQEPLPEEEPGVDVDDHVAEHVDEPVGDHVDEHVAASPRLQELVDEGRQLLERLSLPHAEAVARAIASEWPHSPVACALVQMLPAVEPAREEEDDGVEAAAVKIQSSMRGMRDRKAVRERRRAQEARRWPEEELSVLVEEGSSLLCNLPLESAADVVRALRDESTSSAVAKVLYDKLVQRTPSQGSAEDEAELALLVEEGTNLLCKLPMEEAMELVRTMHTSCPTSPVAKALYDKFREDAARGGPPDAVEAQSSASDVPKLQLSVLEEGDRAPPPAAAQPDPSRALRQSLTERSRECLKQVVAEGRELMRQMEGLDSNVLGLLVDKVGSNPLASVLYYEATNILGQTAANPGSGRPRPASAAPNKGYRPASAAARPPRPASAAAFPSAPPDPVLSQRTWQHLEDLVSEGSELLQRLEVEDAEDILRTIRERAASSPLAALLLDQLLAFRPRGIISDPAALCSALSARSQRSLADLLAGGRRLIGELTEQHGADILQTLHESARTSPVAAALLYEVLCTPAGQASHTILEGEAGASEPEEPGEGLRQLSARTRGTLDALVKEGQELGRRLRDEQTEALLSTLQEWAGSNTLAAAVTMDLLTYRPARAPSGSGVQTTRRMLSARSRRRLQELRTEGLQLARQLGNAGDEELVRMLPTLAPANPLAAVLYSELVTTWFSGAGEQNADLERGAAVRRAMSAQSRRRLEELMGQGRALLERLDEGPALDLMQTLLDERDSPIACVIRSELLAAQAGRPQEGDQNDEDGELLTARTRARIEEVLGECGKLVSTLDRGSTDSLLHTLSEQAGKSPLGTVLYNAMLWSLTGRQREGADGSDGWKDFKKLVQGVGAEGREEVGRLVTESAALMEALGQGNARSVLEVIRGQQGSSPLSTVMYNRMLEGLTETPRAPEPPAAETKAPAGEAETAPDVQVVQPDEDDDADDEREDEEGKGKAEAEEPDGAFAAAEEAVEAALQAAREEAARLDAGSLAAELEEARAAAAVTIQGGVRSLNARRECARRRSRSAAAVTLQCALRGMAARRAHSTARDAKSTEAAEPEQGAEEDALAAEEAAGAAEAVRGEAGPSSDEFPDPVPSDPFWFVATMHEDLRSEVHTYLWRKRHEEDSPLARIAEQLRAREIGPRRACIETELLLLPIRWRNTRATSTALPYVPPVAVRRRFTLRVLGSKFRRAALSPQRRRSFKSNAAERERVAWKWAPKPRVQRESREFDASDAQQLRRRTTFEAVRERCVARASIRETHREFRRRSGLPFRSVALIRAIQRARARQNLEVELVLHKRRVKLGRPPSMQAGFQPESAGQAAERYGQAKARRSAEVLQRQARGYFARLAAAEAVVRCDLREAATRRLQRWARREQRVWAARLEMRGRMARKAREVAEGEAALRVQGAYRGRMARLDRRFLARIKDKRREQEQEEQAAIKTQTFFRKMLARKMVGRIKQNKLTRFHTNQPLRASMILQCAMRSHWARRRYASVKDTVFFGFACHVAIRLQAWSRKMAAKRHALKVARALHMMQQWSAGFAWRRTVTDLTCLAAADWRALVKHTTTVVGPRAAFGEAQELAPGVMPNWWLGHFPVSFSSRVNLKAAPLLQLQEQLRKDRILALGGASRFEKSLQMVAELVREVTEVHAEALDLSESYEALVSLLAFCNIHGCELAARGEVSSQHAGHELLMYASKLADGPNLSVPGMREKLEFRQWTQCNLTRVYYLEGEHDKASHHARFLGSMTTGEPRRDALTKVTSMLYLAAIQSKACKHNTAVSTLQAASDSLAKWCSTSDSAASPSPSWTTFCCSKDLTRRYRCTTSHLAAVCQYNLSVELAARGQYPQAVVAAKRAVALAAIDKLAEPVFHRRSVNTLAAMEVISQQPASAANRRPPEIVDRLRTFASASQDDFEVTLQQAPTSRAGVFLEDAPASRPGTSTSSLLSANDTIRVYRPSQTGASPATPSPTKGHFDSPGSPPPPRSEDDAMPLHKETSRRRFGVWFPPHVALRNKINVNQERDAGQQAPENRDHLAPASPMSSSSTSSRSQGSMQTAFLRTTVSLVEPRAHGPISPSAKLAPVTVSEKRHGMNGWQSKRNLLESQLNAELLLLNMVPLQQLDGLELVTPEGVSLRQSVLTEENPKAALEALMVALNATNTHSNLGLKPSPSARATMKDIAVVAILSASKYMALGQVGISVVGCSQAEKDQVQQTLKSQTKWAGKFARIASTILFGGSFKGEHGEIKALVSMQMALCQALAGQMQAAMYAIMELKTAYLGKPGRQQMLTVLLLNLSTMMSKVDMHKEAFEACDEAWQILRAMDHEDWNCYSPGHSIEETTRVPWGMLCGFCKFQQAAQSLWMGFEGPALKLAERSHALTHKKNAPSSLPPDAVLGVATEKVLQCILEWGQATSTPPLLSRWIAAVPPPPQPREVPLGPPVRVVKQLNGEKAQGQQDKRNGTRSVRRKVG